MKMAKKLLAVALAGVLALSVLTGCGNSVSGKSLVDALKKMDVKVEYDSKLNDTAKNTLAAIETIVNSEDNKNLDEKEQVTLDNAVVANTGKVVVSTEVSLGFGQYKVSYTKGDVKNDTVKKALNIDGVNVDKKVQVALVKTEKATEDSSLQAARVKDALVLANGDTQNKYAETGKVGYAKTKNGKYMLVVIVTDKAADTQA